jgi:hypothetical protein
VRAQQAHPRLSGPVCVALVAALGGLSLACALGTHDVCVNPPPPVDQPTPGTALADYCSEADKAHPWALTLLPMVLAGLGIAIVGRHTKWTLAICATIAAAVLINVAVASQLTSSLTL